MELVYEILFYIFRIIISIIILAIIAYFSLPFFFGKVWGYDATYKYSNADFDVKKIKKLALSEQINQPELIVDPKTGEYSIRFGEGRTLARGKVKIHIQKKWYSSLPTNKENRLILRDYLEENGSDVLGEYKKYILTWKLEEADLLFHTNFYYYIDQSFIIFEQNFPQEMKNTSIGDFNKQITVFPCFINESPNSNVFSFKNSIFSPPIKKLKHTSAPVMFYDDELNSFIISTMNNFLVGMITQTETINCGIAGEVVSIPKDFKYRYIMYFGKGINKTFKNWGNIILKFYKKKPHSAYEDPILSYIGYWTDNGAHYYYKKEKGMNYQQTFEKLLEYATKEKIPFGYYQFDSWWYYKAFAWMPAYINMLILNGGIKKFEFKKHEFPDGIQALQKKLGTPIACHSRWFHGRSEYTKKFKFHRVGRIMNSWGLPLENNFWDYIMKQAKSWGLALYEQDWMNNQFKKFKYLRNHVEHARTWLLQMGQAASKYGISIQYCMATPAMFMQSVELPNVTNVRTGEDYNARFPKHAYIPDNTQTMILIHALGIWPSIDTFRTNNKPGHFYIEKYPVMMTLLAVLSAGVIGPSDPIGYINRNLIMKTCRDDGLILKPDRPLAPVDFMFKKHSTYYICNTTSEKNNLTWHYLWVVNIHPKRVKNKNFSLEELEITGDYILYDYITNKIQEITKKSKIYQNLKKNEFKYYILAPLINGNLAIIGNPDKFVTCSNKQFPEVESTENEIKIQIEDLPSTQIPILIYSKNKPSNIIMDNEDVPELSKEGLNSQDIGWNYNSNRLEIKIILNEDGKSNLLIKY
ncbi:MAG: hypothetical protein ACTSR3_05600 [Candidatus Helarchaeota archaeon]